MEKLVVLVFDGLRKAQAGLRALRELDLRGEISLFEATLASKKPDGGVEVVSDPDDQRFPLVGVCGLVGMVLGVLGGIIGVLGGAIAGALAGFIIRLQRAGLTDDFVNDVSMAVAPGRFAVIAELSEDSTTALDTRIREIGGAVFRRTRAQAWRMHQNREAAERRAMTLRVEAEEVQAKADSLNRLDASFERLGERIERALLRQRSRILFRELQQGAGVQALGVKADQSQEDNRRHLEARITEFQRECDEQHIDAA